jgi:hypothetical protein
VPFGRVFKDKQPGVLQAVHGRPQLSRLRQPDGAVHPLFSLTYRLERSRQRVHRRRLQQGLRIEAEPLGAPSQVAGGYHRQPVES